MKKIDTLFLRDTENPRLVTQVVNPSCQWVLDGEGTPTVKWDGSACLIREGRLYKRMEWDGQKGAAPAQWLHHDFDPAQRSGHGWWPVGDGPEDWMHRKAIATGLPDGTYELIGPKLGKNPEGVTDYMLVKHGDVRCPDAPRTFEGLRAFFEENVMEGLVWHHPDGRMAKIKTRDFGLRWPRPKVPFGKGVSAQPDSSEQSA